jgi:hypothetical protein
MKIKEAEQRTIKRNQRKKQRTRSKNNKGKQYESTEKGWWVNLCGQLHCLENILEE